jgi:hypothetical protein
MHNIDMLIWVCLILILVIGITVSLVLIDTVRQKGRFGINLNVPNCPKCGEQAPVIRKPKTVRQFLWGGGNCAKCGSEIDKWGNEIIQKNS